MGLSTLSFTDSPSIKGREDRYVVVRVQADKALKSWQKSLFSFEWLTPDGKIRPIEELPLREHERRLEAENALKSGHAMERPVLGIGLMDNIEIGAGKAVFMTLAASGITAIEVHVPVSNQKEFKAFLSN